MSDWRHDEPLDWFQIACADCKADGANFGYQCLRAASVANSVSAVLQQEYSEPLTARPSCTSFTWDTRTAPFPEVFRSAYSGVIGGHGDDATSSGVRGGVDKLAPFEIMLDANGSVLLERQFQQPVYVSHFESEVVLMMFIGRRWIIVLLLGDSFENWRSNPEHHLDRLVFAWSLLETKWISSIGAEASARFGWRILPMYVSKPVDFIGTELMTPEELHWYTIDQGDYDKALPSALSTGTPLDTVLLCSTCHESFNPCHSGGLCRKTAAASTVGAAAGGSCICRPGHYGSLCESSMFGCLGEFDIDALIEGGACFHGGACKHEDQTCTCPSWRRNSKSHQVHGDLCQYLPNCWDFEDDGISCFELGTCKSAGCDHGGRCLMDGTCDCEASSGASGKLCEEQINCWEYELDGKDCEENGTCQNIACNGGTCSANGSCGNCPRLSSGRFCHVAHDCFESEIGGADSDCFLSGRCTNAGCANGGLCQRDGSCTCPFDPLDDGELLDDNNSGAITFSGKLCQIQHGKEFVNKGDPFTETDDDESTSAPVMAEVPCEVSGCIPNGGRCNDSGICVCPLGLTGSYCGQAQNCFEHEVGGEQCVEARTCTNKACHIRSNNSTCGADGSCSCPELHDVELYGKLCNKEWPIDDCFEAEEDGKDCFQKGTCSNAGCSNGGKCLVDGSCDCTSLFWGKVS